MKVSQTLPRGDDRVWAHPSIGSLMALAEPNEEPEDVIRRKCRELVAGAKESGWAGPPYDPEILAGLCDIEVEAVDADIRADARIFPCQDGRLLIQYTRTVSAERQRFSICHEIAHTRFPDCYEEVRYRQNREKFDPRHHALERLCNIGASELLIPHEDFVAKIKDRQASLEVANQLRRTFGCSMEAMLRRIVDRSNQSCAVVFLTKRLKPKEERWHPEFDLGLERPHPKFRVDYSRSSAAFAGYFPEHKSAPDFSVVYRAVGEHFPSAVENWDIDGLTEHSVQAAALPLIAKNPAERVAALFLRTS